jgi:deaminated glutathione amidase
VTSATTLRVAAVQIQSSPDRERNHRVATELIGEAAADGARLVALPELFGFLGSGRHLRAGAEPLDGPTVSWAADLARRHDMWVLAGSFVERAGDHLFNTSCLVAPTGELTAHYRKVHLFDVEIEGAGTHESELYTPGDAPVTTTVDDLVVGLSVCYDLRSPELYRILTLLGASVLTVPSAFTAQTGRDHWELLLRARAVENQVFVLAPDQCGTSADGIERHGHSLVIDPWGTVLADAGVEEGVAVADLDLDELHRVRRVLPSLANRRPEAYRWPTG